VVVPAGGRADVPPRVAISYTTTTSSIWSSRLDGGGGGRGVFLARRFTPIISATDRPTQLTALALIGRAHRAGHPAIIELLQLSIGGRLGE